MEERRHGRFVVFALHIYLIFVTKCRRGLPGAEASEFTEDDHHVDLLAGYLPALAIPALLNSLEGISP
jgi:putative transposase